MTNVRDLLPFARSIQVRRGANPIVNFQDEVNKLFGDFFGELSLPEWGRTATAAQALAVNPAIDVSESEKEFKISAELPGLDAKDVSVSVADGYVTIKGEKTQEKKEEREGYHRQERSYGAFQRVIALPDTANLDKVEAQHKNGVLTLSIPKQAAQSKERKIEIKSAA